MGLKAEASNRKALLTTQAVKKACQSIVEAHSAKASSALREEVQKKGTTVEQLFEELAGKGKASITEAAFTKCLLSLDLGMSSEHAKLLSKHVEVGDISKHNFVSFVQKYYIVASAIALTTEFDIGKAKTLRKAEIDELIEILEGPKTDEKLSVTRVRGKALLDGVEGWISVKGNQGTAFLKEVEKPYYTVSGNDEVPLGAAFKLGEGEDVRSLKPGEVLELLEGPKKETYENGLRARGKANSDDATGWFTVRDKKGTVFAEAEGKIYTCTSQVAMTDGLDIKTCAVVKKLVPGDLFTVIEGPIEDKESSVTRVKAKTDKDDKVGWITLKGNAGTVYGEASKTHYAVTKEVPLQKALAAASPTIRALLPGEAIQVLEGPKAETYQPAQKVKVRATTDGATGWITVQAPAVKRWTPLYKCILATALHSAVKADGAEVLRDVAVGEILELQEGPREEAGELRMKAKAKKDNAVGWVTIRNAEGKRCFSC